MPMYDSILIPTDGSEGAQVAGEVARSLATQSNAHLHVLFVEESADEAALERGATAVETIVDRAADAGVDTTGETIDSGEPVHRAILGYAEDRDVDAIVMGTHGQTRLDQYLLGSVAERTLRESTIPVVTVHEDVEPEAAFDRVLIPTDGSESSETAATHGARLAAATGAELHAVHVVETGLVRSGSRERGEEYVETAAERARDSGVSAVETAVLEGRPHQTILAYAAEHDVDWIVMGSHGKTGIRRYLLGSVTERVVRFANAPVITVKPPRVTTTVEYLDYAVVDERGWPIDEVFAEAAEADLDEAAHGMVEVARDEYILDAAEAAGLDWPFHCRAGGCVECAAVVVAGDLEMEVQRSLSDEEIEERDLRLTCVATPTTDEVKLLYNARHLDVLQDRVL